MNIYIQHIERIDTYMLNILINGCNGNMGKVVKQYINKTPDISVKYEIDINTPTSFETLNTISDKPDIIIDFSTPKRKLCSFRLCSVSFSSYCYCNYWL